MDFANQYDKVKDSVFAVFQVDQNEQIKIGSGVYVDGGFAITCAHCITDINKMYITFDMINLQKISNIKIDTKLDLAVFPLEHKNPTVKIKTSKSLEIGKECFFVGYPLDVNQQNASHGYVSSFAQDQNGTNLIRLDSSINKGNSGGPLFNYDCELVGIINAKHRGLSEMLRSIVDYKPNGQVIIAGVDPIAVIQQMIAEMDYYMNLGIGYAIAIDQVIKIEPTLAIT